MELISEYIIPGLRALQEDFEVMDKNSVVSTFSCNELYYIIIFFSLLLNNYYKIVLIS